MCILILGICVGFLCSYLLHMKAEKRKAIAQDERLHQADDLIRQRDNWVATAELYYDSGENEKAIEALIESDKIMSKYQNYIRINILDIKKVDTP